MQDRDTPTDGAASNPLGVIAANLRAERARAALSLSEVARRAGVSKSTLSQLESGQGNPSVETLWSIAVALGIPFSVLVAAPQTPTRTIRVADRPNVAAADANYVAALLAPGGSARRDVYVITMEPGAPRASDPHGRGTVEHVIVGAGSVRVGPVGETVDLGVGDYASFPGDVDHVYDALEPDTWAVMVLEHPGA